jgi:hypothetical protein
VACDLDALILREVLHLRGEVVPVEGGDVARPQDGRLLQCPGREVPLILRRRLRHDGRPAVEEVVVQRPGADLRQVREGQAGVSGAASGRARGYAQATAPGPSGRRRGLAHMSSRSAARRR